MPTLTAKSCFLINHSFRDRNGHFEITLYAVDKARHPVKILISTFRPLFFVSGATPAAKTSRAIERKPLPLRAMKNNEPVDCCYFATYTAFSETGRMLREQGCTLYESDVSPVERFLMERFVAGGFVAEGSWEKHGLFLYSLNPRIRGAAMEANLEALSLDIETNGFTGEILSIACSGKKDVVFTRGKGTDTGAVFFCSDERTLLTRFFAHVTEEDPDVLIGWNIVDFDLWTLQTRCVALNVAFAIGREGCARIAPGKREGQRIARIPGRAVIDVPIMLRSYFYTFEEYSLEFVASAMLGKHKSIGQTGRSKIEEINRLFKDDPPALASYNLLDAQLTKEIFEHANLLPNAVERSKRSGHLLDRSGGSVAAFDYLYLPRLHRAGFVAPDAADREISEAPLPGGHVLEPKPGLYENVLVFDFRSLYPSLIMTFAIDPLGLFAPSEKRIQGPEGPSFAADLSILPAIIAELLEARVKAKKENNPYLSQAIKILMNSFYGVLGAQGCRFFSAELATTITRTGQYILKQTIGRIEESTGFPVIYGDTDSLFVLLGKGAENKAHDLGGTIAGQITAWLAQTLKERFGVSSALLLQFEGHFRYFFMPALRGSTQGSKKHYCGATVDNSGMKLTFKGMESARSDWTDLAKEFQHELFRRFFTGEPLEAYIVQTMNEVREGRADEKLIYKKRLRKRIEEYTENIPPHVQAARQLDEAPHLVRYYITVSGPQPVEKRSAAIDYNHYIECQIKPIADSVLETIGESFDRIVSGQQDLFG
jgi:DNA polymerase II